MVCGVGLMEESILEGGSMESKTDKACSLRLRERKGLAYGRMEKECSGWMSERLHLKII